MKDSSLRSWLVAMACATIVSACESDNAGEPKDYGELSRVSINLTLTVNQELESRATNRPLDSSDAGQKVSDMRVYLFRANLNADPDDLTAFRYSLIQTTAGGTAQPYIYVDDFEKDYVWRNASHETHPFLVNPYLEKGYQYRLLAIGRDDISPDDESESLLNLSTESGDGGWVDVSENPNNATTLAEVAMAVNVNKVRFQTCELFAGYSEALAVTEDSEDFTSTIKLTREVAGIILYIENIPTHFKALAEFSRPGILPPYNPVVLVTKGKEYKVSSVAIAPLSITSKVSLATAKSCGETAINENFRGYFADYNLQSAQTNEGIFVNTTPGNDAHPNSLLVGSFVLPIDTPAPSQLIEGYDKFDHTLYLVFYTTENDIDDHTFAAPFFWYPIGNIAQRYDEATGAYVDAPDASYESAYPLRANHIYSLGEKYGEVDEPVDLSALATPSRSISSPRLIIR